MDRHEPTRGSRLEVGERHGGIPGARAGAPDGSEPRPDAAPPTAGGRGRAAEPGLRLFGAVRRRRHRRSALATRVPPPGPLPPRLRAPNRLQTPFQTPKITVMVHR